jgi:hypothetical protein
MKRIIKHISIITLVFFFSACNDILDVENLGAFDPSTVWSDQQLTNGYLANLYASVMPSAWPVGSGNFHAGGSADETLGTLDDGLVTSTSHPWQAWGAVYQAIRKINVLFSEIDNGTLEPAFKNKIKGQAHFLRAWSYFHLLRVYGGVPLLDKPQDLTDDLLIGRASTAETFAFVEADLDKAIELLAGQKFADADRGKIGSGAALAFKGRVMLYKASPQFNPNAPYSNPHWAAALEATKKAKNDLEGMGFGLVANYNNIWNIDNEGNNESVMTVIFSDPDKTDGRREASVRPLSESKNATGGDQPIWKFVTSFPMADGFQPGESPNYEYDMQTYWENRDPRFYANIIGNGFVYELSGKTGRRQYTDGTFATKLDQFGPTAEFNRTGFFPLKGVQKELTQDQIGLNSVDWIEIRYAEVLLNYAEAANETGDHEAALTIIKQIRERAGIEAGDDGNYGVTASGKEAIREAIYHERYIEFAFEGKRFWDLRRARLLHTILDGTKEEGLLATLKEGLATDVPDNTYGPDDFTYEVKDIYNGINLNTVPESYYFFPIPLSEINKNANLDQNVDWGGTFNPSL